jgi:hypothetical protein
METKKGPESRNRREVDWRGWIALAWVVWWGWAYCKMVVEVKGPQVLELIRTVWK